MHRAAPSKRRAVLAAGLSVLALTAGGVGAQAQDLVNPPYVGNGPWTGFYAGAHAGFGTANYGGIFDADEAFPSFFREGSVFGEDFEVDGSIFGMQAGYDREIGGFLYGVEADWTWFGKSDRVYDAEDEGPDGLFTDNATAELNWLASLRGRAGLVSGRTLVYGTAGVAWADAGYAAQDRDNGGPERSIAFSGAGYVVGGGIEHLLTPNLALRLEGLYYGFDLSRDTSNLTADSDPGDSVVLDDVLVARLGLSYRFGGQGEAGLMQAASTYAPNSGAFWNGFYAGGHAGYGMVDFDSIYDISEIENPFDTEDSVLGNLFDLDSAMVGLQAGYNWSSGDMVFGVEGDWTWLGSSDRRFDPYGDFAFNDSAGVAINWLASLRARVGVVSGNTLIYGTGGIAWAEWEYDAVDDDGFGGASGFSRTATGLVAGGGMEVAFSEHCAFRIEALHYMFGDRVDTRNLTLDSDPGDFAELGGVTVFRAGLSFKLPVH